MTAFFVRRKAGRLASLVLSSVLVLAQAAVPTLAPTGAEAQAIPAGYSRPAPIIVRNDPGGDVGARANKIRAMADSGQSVEIRGACYSACTMYLGLPGSCISRNVQFGFHRPSFYGAALAPDQFEFWSRIIAAHYPPALRNWYLAQGRYSARLQMLSGAQLIDLGIRECA